MAGRSVANLAFLSSLHPHGEHVSPLLDFLPRARTANFPAIDLATPEAGGLGM
jgi:hypothetical protein